MTGRLRRDPRADRAARQVPAMRARYGLERSLGGAVAERRAMAETPRVQVVTDPAFLVFAVPDAAGGRFSAHDREVLGAAHVLAGAAGAVVLLAPPLGDDAGAAGADRLATLDVAPGYDPAARAATVAAAIAMESPQHTLFPETPDGGDLARRVAVLTGATLFAGAEALSASTAVRACAAGTREQHGPPPLLLTLAPGRFAAYAGPPREARPIPLPAVAPGPGLPAVDLPVDPALLALTDAEFVVAAGNGVTDFAAFTALAAALGATPGGSRVVCDNGSMPRDRQVGASGSVLQARCYLALGIAGAPQHLQGVAGVRHVVAVNTDLHAAMVARAELSVVADAQPVMAALLAALAAGR